MSDFNKIDLKRFLWLLNHIKNSNYDFIKNKEELNEYNYIDKIHIDDLIKIINENERWKNSSKEALFFTLSKFLKLNHKERVEDIKRLSQHGYNFKIQNEERDGFNTLDEKELEAWKPLKYFKNILKNIDEKNIRTQREHNKYLLLNLLTCQNPLRTHFYLTCKIIKLRNDIKKDENYILIEDDKIFYYVGKDKITNKTNTEPFIEIQNKSLKKKILKSIKQYERTYLFEQNNSPVSDKTLLSYLKEITQIPNITINIMRSIYISNFYKKQKTFNEQKEFCNKSRHTFLTSNLRYKKVLKE